MILAEVPILPCWKVFGFAGELIWRVCKRKAAHRIRRIVVFVQYQRLQVQTWIAVAIQGIDGITSLPWTMRLLQET